ncbi:MAG: STAS domain-containing protein [Isosphaeraceae bacterium]
MLKPRVEIQNVNGILVAEFWDCLRLDQGAVQDLRPKYEAHLKDGGRPLVVVDLLGVGFAGSSALGHFVALQRVARAKNGRVIFCNVDPTVFEVFRVSKLDPLFTFVADRAGALALAESGKAEDKPIASVSPNVTKAPTPGPLRNSGGDGLLRSSRKRKL